MEWVLEAVFPMDYMYVSSCLIRFSPHTTLLRPLSSQLTRLFCPEAFYGIIDLLAILPYYIEIALAQDTVRSILPLPHKF